MAGSVRTLGGKGSSFTSSLVYDIANGIAQVRIDSSILDRLNNSSSSSSSSSFKYRISIPEQLTLQESRAYLVVLLNKLLLSSSGSSSVLTALISETLNSQSKALAFEEIDVTEDELVILEKSSASLIGVCAILDHQASALSVIADTVAALSCEALKADVSVLSLMDSGDGFSVAGEIGVARDLKVLLNGSKLVGNVECDSVSDIPMNHGSLREVVRSVHLRTRVELNSGVKVGRGGSGGGGTGQAVVTTVLSLASALRYVGLGSLSRAKMNLDAIGNENLRLIFDKKCPSLDSLTNVVRLISEAGFNDKYFHEVNLLLGIVWEIVIWEAIVAYVLLEGSSVEKTQTQTQTQITERNGMNEKSERKSEKKKKKVVLGKGTAVVVQYFKDSLLSGVGNGVDNLGLLEKLVGGLYAVLDPKDPEFDNLLTKVKEIVESNDSRRLPKIPKGTRDFSKEQMAIRERAFSIITQVFKRHGAMALDTPVYEMRETLMGKYGEDSKLIFDLADQGGELCSLRYDLTVPFARYVAMNGLTSFKRYQIAKVYRRDNPSRGRYREFYQCDFDIAGQRETMGPDFEVIKTLTELLDELAIGDYEVKLNHRMLLDGMLEICGVPPEKFRTICSSIDKLDKMSFEQIKNEMVEEKGLAADTADMIGTFVKEKGSPLELLSQLKQEGSKFLENNGSVVALNELEILFKALEKSKCISKVVFDLSLARGLDYYTGVIYEAVFKGATQVGSIAAGGRYDNLIGMFGTKPVPAVGVSLGIERIFIIMEQIQRDRNQITRATETQVLVGILGDEKKDVPQAAELVNELWDAGIKAEFRVSKRYSKHIEHAKDSRIPWMVFVGESELKEGIVKLKEIETNKEDIVVPRSRFVEELQRQLT